jgi:hypothetical protein
VPEQFLDGADVGPAGQQMGGEGMSKCVTTSVFLDSQLSNGRANRLLKIRRIKVVSSSGAAPRINRRLCRGVDILPTPFAVRVRVLASQCIRQLDAAVSFSQRALVFLLDVSQVFLQWFDDGFGQERDPVLVRRNQEEGCDRVSG